MAVPTFLYSVLTVTLDDHGQSQNDGDDTQRELTERERIHTQNPADVITTGHGQRIECLVVTANFLVPSVSQDVGKIDETPEDSLKNA